MQEYSNTNAPGKDPELWEIAKKRASFKTHLLTYLVMVPFFWLVWWFTGGKTYGVGIPWPVWPMGGWGLGLFFHYLGAYVIPRSTSVEREYEKLQRNKRG
jgi:hypothetical protein